MPESHRMLAEIREEAGVVTSWKELVQGDVQGLSSALKSGKGVYLTGSGTSFHAALYTAIILSRRGIAATSFPASEYHSFTGDCERKGDEILIAFSQSGESSDSLNSVKHWIERGGFLTGISSKRDSELCRMSDSAFFINVGEEKALPATKTHLAQLLFGISLLSPESSFELPFDAKKLTDAILQLSGEGNSIRNLARQKTGFTVVLGSGLNYPIALEGALKIKETSSTLSEGYATREFLHGPKQTLARESLVLMLSPDDKVRHDLDPFARVLDVGEFLHDNYLIDPEDEVSDSICKLVFLQLFAFHKAIALGKNPDAPTLLTKVVK